MKLRITTAGIALAALAGLAFGQAKEIRIAHVYDKTGPLEAYAKQTHNGLMLGFSYATGGRMEVLGRKIVVIEKDSQTKPDVGKAQLAAAYGDDKVDLAIGPTSSGVALAMLPIAEEAKKILLVEPAVADQITGEAWNRYIFRTGRSSSQDALAAYKAVPGMEGATYYYYEHPKNKVNDWLVAEHKRRFDSPPDFFTAGGMAAALAVIEALKKAGGTDTEKLIAAMEGMSFDTPKGRMTFRKEDHQAMQSMYHFKIRVDPSVDWAIPQLVREIKPDEMKVPIRVKK